MDDDIPPSKRWGDDEMTLSKPEDDKAPRRALYAIGTINYDDQAFNESEEAAQLVRTSVPRSLLDIVVTLGSLEFSIKSPVHTFGDGTRIPGHCDLDADQLAQVLTEVSTAGDIVVVYYTGHGVHSEADGYFLCTKDFQEARLPRTGLKASELPGLVLKRDANDPTRAAAQQTDTLIILDCCFSGAGGLEILRTAASNVVHRNLWIWATSGTWAKSGIFAKALSDVLRDPKIGPSTSYVPWEEVTGGLAKALKGHGQELQIYGPPGYSKLPEFFPNRNHREGLRNLTVGEQRHWISKALGGPDISTTTGWYITGHTGRIRAASVLAEWLSDAARGHLAVVTGHPGSGKSTLLSLIVLLANPRTRGPFLRNSTGGPMASIVAQQLEESTAMVAVHARGLNTDQLSHSIAESLGLIAVTALGLLSQLDEHPHMPTTTIVIDALDEASDADSQPHKLLYTLLVPLAGKPRLRVIIGARRHILPPSDQVDLTVDLDDDIYRDREAVVDYVSALLIAEHEPTVDTPYKDGSGRPDPNTVEVAHAVSRLATQDGGDSFLTAQMIALAVRHRESRVQTDYDGWETQIPKNLPAAFDEDMAAKPGEDASAAGALMEALAWARGPGLPWESVWVENARVLGDLHSGNGISSEEGDITDDDVRQLLDRASAYIREDVGPGRRSVFKPLHDELTVHLRSKLVRDDDNENARRLIERRMVRALKNSIPVDADGHTSWGRAHPYLRSYLAEHAAAAGPDQLTDLVNEPGFLAMADPTTLVPLLSVSVNPSPNAQIYLRCQQLLGDDPSHNAAYLQEAAVCLTGEAMSFVNAGIIPTYQTVLQAVGDNYWSEEISRGGSAVAIGTMADGRILLAADSGMDSVDLWVADNQTRLRRDGTLSAGVHTEHRHSRRREIARYTQLSEGMEIAYTTAIAVGVQDGATIVAVGTSDGVVTFWSPESRTTPGIPFATNNGAVTAIALRGFARGTTSVATGGEHGVIQLWTHSAAGLELLNTITGFKSTIAHLAFVDVEHQQIMIVGVDGIIALWAPDTGIEMVTTLTERPSGSAVGILPDERRIIASGAPGSGVQMWSDNGDKLGEPISSHGGKITAVAFANDKDGRGMLASVSASFRRRSIIDVRTLEDRSEDRHLSPVSAVAFGRAANGRHIMATGSNDETVRLWDPATGRRVHRPLRGHDGGATAIAFRTLLSGQALLAVARRSDGQINIYDAETLEVRCTIAVGTDVGSLSFAPSGYASSILAAGSRDGSIRLWDAEGGNAVGKPLPGSGGPVAFEFGQTPDGLTFLAAGGFDGAVRFWDPSEGTVFNGFDSRLDGDLTPISSMAIGRLPDERLMIATGCRDGTVRLWDMSEKTIVQANPYGSPLRLPTRDKRLKATLTGHAGTVIATAFCKTRAGQSLLATGSRDGTVRLWDPTDNAFVTTIHRHSRVGWLSSADRWLAIRERDGLSLLELT